MVAETRADLRSIEHVLEELFRLSMGRRAQSQQSAAAGASVSRAGYAVLRTLGESGPLTMGDLARRSTMDPAVAARQANALEADGLIRAFSDQHDGRVRIVELTALGEDVLDRVIGFRTAYLGRVLASWGDDDRSDLVRIVDRLVRNLRAVPFQVEEE